MDLQGVCPTGVHLRVFNKNFLFFFFVVVVFFFFLCGFTLLRETEQINKLT